MRELGVNLRVTSGPAIERAGDLAAIVNDLDEGDVLFIEEIHRLARVFEEILYPAMEENSVLFSSVRFQSAMAQADVSSLAIPRSRLLGMAPIFSVRLSGCHRGTN